MIKFNPMIRFFATIAAAMTVAAAAGQTLPSPAAGVTQVTLPALPTELYFAGERVPMENFDTRESMMRDLLVTCNMHSRTMLTLLNTRRYFAVIEPILARNGVPADFKYLCMAESGLDPNIVSSARAAGLWQIMPGTGSDAGLEVGTEVDERYDVERATEAACRILLASYKRFGSWTLAAAAYNLGDAGLAKRLELQAPLTSYYDIWLPDETRRYLFRVLSFKLLCNNPAACGFGAAEGRYYQPHADYHTVEVSGADIKWPAVAAANGTTYKMLRELNPWIRDYAYANKAGRKLTVKIPDANWRVR
jgi:hypothetical protein